MILLILAAGLGSRFGGDKQIDGLGPNGEWIMDLNLRDAADAGFKRAVIVCRIGMKDTIATHLSRFAPADMHIGFATQDSTDLPRSMPSRTKPWGTGHALLAARDLLDEPFLVANADDCYGPGCFIAAAQFLDSSCSHNHAALVTYELGRCCSDHGSVSRGVCTSNAQGQLVQIIEHHDIQRINGDLHGSGPDGQRSFSDRCPVSLNSWCLHPACFIPIWQRFDAWLARNPGEQDEFYLPSALDELLHQQILRIDLLSCQETWLGMTYQADRPSVSQHLKIRFSACQVLESS